MPALGVPTSFLGQGGGDVGERVHPERLLVNLLGHEHVCNARRERRRAAAVRSGLGGRKPQCQEWAGPAARGRPRPGRARARPWCERERDGKERATCGEHHGGKKTVCQ